jgi:type-F conjugative transfer system pilin assembly thiol-disulfide isomerase TrbB
MSKSLSFILFLGLSLSAFAESFINQHRLVFIFSSHCPHCHNQAPILKAYAQNHQFLVEAYSLDNQGLPEFSQFEAPSEDLLKTAFAEQSIQTPAIFIVNTETLALYPVSIGEVNFDELQSRISVLSSKIIAFEQGDQA